MKQFKSKGLAVLLLFGLQTIASDLNAVGGLSPYSNKELDQLEKEFIQQINQSSSVVRHPLANQYINELGKRLAFYGHIKTPHLFLVKSREINAFAGPGGHIGINSQLILTTQNESELAAVLAHEIAHVRLHHLYAMLEHQKQMQIPMLASLLAAAALGAINPTVGMGAMTAAMSGFNQNSINFTRTKEKEADRIGIDMLIKAGFNPLGMAAFFKKMQQHTRYYYTANIPAILRSHPLDDDRIAEAENRTARLKSRQYRDSLDYALFKELIRTSVAMVNQQVLDYYDHQCHKQNPEPAACQYGYALVLLNTNQYVRAQNILENLATKYKDTIYFQIALSEAEAGLKQYSKALERSEALQKNYPDNYAALMTHANVLIAANQPQSAASILLKGFRRYKEDLPLCKMLARAQAQAKQKSYAYFTQAQCLLLEGQPRGSIAQLKVAQKLAKHDTYMTARITAKIEEIKYRAEFDTR